jgi:ribulose-phosphate 3-epimerase
MIQIAPSILSADFRNLEQQVKAAEKGGADWIHCDIMDGHFVPNLTFGPMLVEAVNQVTHVPIDVHLMILQPERYLEQFYKAGADSITVHQETCPHLHRTVSAIHELGAKAGVSVNPSTPVSTLDHILEYVDLILIMSVNPGFGGQKFISGSVSKIKELKSKINGLGLSVKIEVDGGIDVGTAPLVSEAGAEILVAGSSIFRQPNIEQAILRLRQSAESTLSHP